MTYFVLGLVLFFGIHSVSIVAPQWRDATARRVGEWTWKGIYSVVAIVGFVLLVWGYGQARLDPVALYVPLPELRWVTAILMVPVFPMLLAAYFPGRIKALLKHPMLAATKLWAVAHLLSNGMLPDVLLFGAFLVWAIADRVSLKHRAGRPLPAVTSRFNDAIAVVLGLVLYFVFLHGLHSFLIGRSPMPG
jgi:uncharacterized membrane protein